MHRIKWDEQTSNTKGDGEWGVRGDKWEVGGMVLGPFIYSLSLTLLQILDNVQEFLEKPFWTLNMLDIHKVFTV